MRYGLGKGKCADFQGFFSKRWLDLQGFRVLAAASESFGFHVIPEHGGMSLHGAGSNKIARSKRRVLLDPALPVRITHPLTSRRRHVPPAAALVETFLPRRVEEVRGDEVPLERVHRLRSCRVT